MGFTPEELKKYAELMLLLQQGVQEALNFINNKRLQAGETTEEIFAHDEETTKAARAKIDAL